MNKQKIANLLNAAIRALTEIQAELDPSGHTTDNPPTDRLEALVSAVVRPGPSKGLHLRKIFDGVNLVQKGDPGFTFYHSKTISMTVTRLYGIRPRKSNGRTVFDGLSYIGPMVDA